MKKKEKVKPEWAPADSPNTFASFVMPGVNPPQNPTDTTQNRSRKPALDTRQYVDGLLRGERTVLGRAITLIESNHPTHIKQGQELLQEILPHTGNSIRIGISGMPGAGKSTLIETLGSNLIKQGHKLAVLAIDPTSSKTGGSILGDKTRMEKLTRSDKAFIRPSPSGGTLGGVARKTRETILICESAGYDVILVETVGVGQNEVTVRSMVDFFLLVQIAGAGDELQGIKKGVMEICDALVVNKADGDNKIRVQQACRDYTNALHYSIPATPGWHTPVFACSALSGEGVERIWQTITEFKEKLLHSGYFEKRRSEQSRDWMHALLTESLLNLFKTNQFVKDHLKEYEDLVAAGKIPATKAAAFLIEAFLQSKTNEIK